MPPAGAPSGPVEIQQRLASGLKQAGIKLTAIWRQQHQQRRHLARAHRGGGQLVGSQKTPHQSQFPSMLASDWQKWV